MSNSKTKPMTLRATEEIKADFKATFEASGASSQNEFLGMLLKKWIVPEEISNSTTNEAATETPLNLTQEETHTVLETSFEASEAKTMDEFLDNLLQNFKKPEKVIEPEDEPEKGQSQLQPNQILLKLTPAQLFAIRETVSKAGFAEDQNEIIDSLDYKKPGNNYHGQISEPEFQILWVRNIVQTDGMTPEEKEIAIRHNMGAYLVNMFLTKLIKGKISDSVVTAKTLKLFIREQPEVNTSAFNAEMIESEFNLLLSCKSLDFV